MSLSSEASGSACPCCAAPLDGPSFDGRDLNHGIGDTVRVASCRGCGSGVTLPAVPEADLGTLYPSAYAAYDLPSTGLVALASRAVRAWQGRHALRSAPVEALADAPPGRAVDVGCGRGDLGETLLRRGWQVTGVEPSAEACAVAERRGLDVRAGTLATAALEPDAYDAASFRHSLEHVADPPAALAATWAALRPGGLLLISVPNFGGWQARRFRSRWYHLDVPRHRTHFTPPGLTRLLERAGFEEVRTSTSSSTMGLPFSIQYALVGRALFPSGLGLRLALLACLATYPVAWALDRIGGGDMLHALARRPA